MNTKYILLACVTLFLLACSKTELSDQQEMPETAETAVVHDSLHFKIWKYDNLLPDSFKMVETTQSSFFINEFDMNKRYIWFANNAETLSNDSLYIIATVRFSSSMQTGPSSYYDLEFFYTEAKNNLKLNADSTLTYHDNRILYTKLQTTNWADPTRQSQAMISFPEVVTHDGVLIEYLSSSNSFVWENEYFDMKKVTWDENNQEIKIAGNFEVNIKGLSCGFFDFYEIKKADFTATIK